MANPSVISVESSDIALEGVNVTFGCSPGSHDFVLSGPSKSTCMKDGKWKPDPTELQCKGTVSIGHTQRTLCRCYAIYTI